MSITGSVLGNIMPWSWKSRAIPLPNFWVTTGPVMGTVYLVFCYKILLVIVHLIGRLVQSQEIFNEINGGICCINIYFILFYFCLIEN